VYNTHTEGQTNRSWYTVMRDRWRVNEAHVNQKRELSGAS